MKRNVTKRSTTRRTAASAKARDRVFRAAIRFYLRYENYYYVSGRRGEPGYQLIRACAAARRGRK